VTVWALRAAGLDARSAARRLGAFLVVLYAVFFAALALAGGASATGAFGGDAPLPLALAAAGVGTLAITLGVAAMMAPADLERRARRGVLGGSRALRIAARW
jgi:hypothetical protein